MKSKSIAKKELDLLNCAKKIRAPKLKRNDQKDFIWWEKQFNQLEKERKIPDYKKLKCLQAIYTDKEIEGIANCGIKIIEEKKSRQGSRDTIQYKRKNVTFDRKSKSAPVKPTRYSNPYMEFMKKPKEEARIWYEKSEPLLEDLPIRERAERIRTNIVQNFVKNFEAIAKSEEINEHTVLSIYEMSCPFPVCSALHSKNEVCGAVPETTAKHLGCYEQSDNNKLLTQILKDIDASVQPPMKKAFGKNLPPELRREPCKENPAAKWIEQNADHINIETFKDVWTNITDLESTRRFCLYLLEHPNVTPPPFLVNEGMLTKKVLRKPVYLGILEKQYENVNTSEFLDIDNLLQSINDTMADFNRRLTTVAKSTSSISVGEISEVNIMV